MANGGVPARPCHIGEHLPCVRLFYEIWIFDQSHRCYAIFASVQIANCIWLIFFPYSRTKYTKAEQYCFSVQDIQAASCHTFTWLKCEISMQEEIPDELGFKKVYLAGNDKFGREVMVLKVNRHLRAKREIKQMNRFLCYSLDLGIKHANLEKNPSGKLCGIFDLRGRTFLLTLPCTKTNSHQDLEFNQANQQEFLTRIMSHVCRQASLHGTSANRHKAFLVCRISLYTRRRDRKIFK